MIVPPGELLTLAPPTAPPFNVIVPVFVIPAKGLSVEPVETLTEPTFVRAPATFKAPLRLRVPLFGQRPADRT